MTHAELRAMGLQRVAAMENRAMRARFGIQITPQKRDHATASAASRYAKHKADTRDSILKFLAENPQAQIKQISGHVNLAPETARGYLVSLQNEGKVLRAGLCNRAFWSVT